MTTEPTLISIALQSIRRSRRCLVLQVIEGDGDIDLLVTFSNILLLSAILHPGDSAAAIVPMGQIALGRSAAFAVADFNGDRVSDIAAAALGTVRIFTGTGRSFELQLTYMALARGNVPMDLKATDFDGDGDVDVLVLTGDGLSVLRNDGAARFDAPVQITEHVDAAADFNNDGRDDLLDRGRIWISLPDGTFAPRGNRREDFSFASAAVADLNRDGNLDAVYVWRDRTKPNFPMVRTVALTKADGTLEFRDDVFTDRRADLAYLVDLDRDGNVDFVTVSTTFSEGGTYLSVTRGNGDGTFQAMTDVQLTSFARTLTFGDFNGDQFPDVSFPHFFSEPGAKSRIAVSLNDGTGGFRQLVGVGQLSQGVPMAADLDKDGFDDLILTDLSPEGFIAIAMSRGDGTFSAERTLATGIPSADRTEVRDFNSDGHTDILVIEETNSDRIGRASLLQGDGKGGLASPVVITTTGVGDVFSGDFNGDGSVDIVDAGIVRLNDCADPLRKRRTVRH